MRRIVGLGSILLLAVSASGTGQVAVRAGAVLGRSEHRVSDDGVLVTSSGTLVGGALAVTFRGRFQIRGGGERAHRTDAPRRPRSRRSADSRRDERTTVAPAERLHPAIFRILARQHWSAWQVGAEARLPLGLENVEAVLRGYWMPVVSVSGLSQPDVALATGIGIDWHGRRLGVSALYTFERYDFPASSTTQRLEELSNFRVRLELWWPPAK
jgi:hypothetical protein